MENEDINKISVLEAFIQYGKLSFADFTNKKIFLDSVNSDIADRAIKLRSTLEDLVDTRILERLSPDVYIVVDTDRAIKERNRLIEKSDKPQMPKIGTLNNATNITGNGAQGGQESRLENVSVNTPANIPSGTETIKKETSSSKALLFVSNNIWKFLIGIAILYIVYRLSLNK